MSRKSLKKLWGRLVRDEQGGEVIEYALLLGLVVVLCLLTISAVGIRVADIWNSIADML